MTRIHPTAARGFVLGAEAYERGRPSYAPQAVQWLSERLGLRAGRVVLDLAAGTGKLTRQLLATGARVLAVEPLEPMRQQLERAVPEAEALEGTAEEIPLPDASVDAVTVAQAFHWFRFEEALVEIHRVLRAEGGLALVWNDRDPDDPLQAEIEHLIAPHRELLGEFRDWRELFEASALFSPVERRTFRFEQSLDVDTLVDTVGSRSYIAALPEADRDSVLARARALTADKPESISLAYVTEVFMCFRQTGRA
jgi:SAM-dependent methyltransferase